MFASLMFAALDIGMYFQHRAVIDHAVRVGCQSGAFQFDADPETTAVTDIEQGLVDAGSDCTSCATAATITTLAADMLECVATVPHEPIVSGLFPVLGNTIEGKALVRLEESDV